MHTISVLLQVWTVKAMILEGSEKRIEEGDELYLTCSVNNYEVILNTALRMDSFN